MAFESEPFNSQSVGSNALNPMHMVSLLDYIVLLQHKACKQTSSEIASVVQTDNSVTYVSKSSTFESWFIDSVQALVSSWKNGNTMPFIFDTVWDLIKLADYLTLREDVDPSNIGITGESLGGMHAWFAAFVDTRYSVVVPIIGVQGFQWAIEHDKWQARVNSIKAVFDARADLDKSTIDKEVVQKVWDRIAPGFSSQFDSPYTVPIIAPRPFLILNGEDDPRSPLGGLKIPESRAHKAYEEANCPRDFKFKSQPGIGHEMTPLMVKDASDWFDRFLKV
ncbi:uncharacterized protein LOC107775071 [Nicotiana tabacum]|uniref:Uncharacterized protein LOC107775071 n=1 Tax=Nicotiana tabacum TaxID=4097 RepID=A0AC58RTW7_TOBAC